MESYSFHFERMSNVDLHPLSLPVSRLSTAKSSSSIAEHLAHHQHGKGDSAYSSFSGGSTAPDYPSLFLPDDLQSSSFSNYVDLKYVKSLYHPAQVLQSNSKTMDQLYHSVEAISQQYHNANVNHHSHNGNESLHTDNKAHSKQEVHLRTQSHRAQTPPHPPPIPARLDSFIATKNLENNRVHTHGTEFQPLQLQSQQQLKPHNRLHSQNASSPKSDAGSSEMGRLSSDPLYSVWKGSQQEHSPIYRPHFQLHDQTRVSPEQISIADYKATPEQQRSASNLSRSSPQGTNQPEQPMPKQPLGGAGCNGDHHNKSSSHFESECKKAQLTQEQHGSELTRAASPWNTSPSLLSSSIQHKGQFYFVTGVCKPSESGLRTHSSSVSGFEAESDASILLKTHRLREKERCHSTMDDLFRRDRSYSSGSAVQDDEVFISASQRKNLPFKSQEPENYKPPLVLAQSCQSFETEEREIGRHTASNPIFYCGPDKKCPPHSATHKKDICYTKNEDRAKRGKRQPLADVASERINKETTPLLYHLTGASRAVTQPKQDPGFHINGNEVDLNETNLEDVAINDNENPAQYDTSKHDRGATTPIPCSTLDDSFKKYYKEKLKDAQCKVLRETSFKRRDLQLSWPHCMKQKPEFRSAVIHSFSLSQDSETSTATLTPSVTSEETEKGSIKEEGWEDQKEINKMTDKENDRPAKVAQPQVARIGGRKRLTPEQKKMCFSEPEKLNLIGSAPVHITCRSFGDESKYLFATEYEEEEPEQQREHGLVAARRKMFETRGRALSASSSSKTNLKHMQHKALVEYMERKTGQKVAEPQQAVPQLPPPPRQRHSLGEKPFDWSPQSLSGSQEIKNMKKQNRPHSAGRILDSPSSSIRYAQFFSAQSCSGHYAGHQVSSKKRESHGPSQGKSASAESLLDQHEPAGFFRNRSISTPHSFQAHDHNEDSLLPNTMETQSAQKSKAEESSVKQVPEGQQYASKVAQRGKSMEELGVSKLNKLPALSKSSEQLDQLRRNSNQLEGTERHEICFVEEREAARRVKRMEKEPEVVGQKNTQEQIQTRRKPLIKQSSEPGEDASGGERSSSRSNSPTFAASSHVKVCSSPGFQAPIITELGSNRALNENFSNPLSPRGQKISESEKKPSSSIRSKMTCENTPCSRPGTSTSGSEREKSVDEPSNDAQPPPSKNEVSLSCGVTTDPSLWLLPPGDDNEEEVQTSLPSEVFNESVSAVLQKQTSETSASPCTSVSDADVSQQVEKQNSPETEAEILEKRDKMEERGAPEGEMETLDRPVKEPKWEELVEAVVKADQSLARVLCPLAHRKTALMLMEQLLSEDTLLMEEHYKKKQEQKGATESTELTEASASSSCLPASDNQKCECSDELNMTDITDKKHLLMSCIKERLSSLEESRGALQMEVEENTARGEALKLLVRDLCQPVEMERYNLFIGDLERVVNLLMCLSARLARVQNALSIVDQHTDAEEKESLDSRHRLLSKQREDAKDLKDNLDRRENLVSTFLSRQLSAEQLQSYRHFVQTKASLLIRQKDLEEKQKLGEEQLEALSNSLSL